MAFLVKIPWHGPSFLLFLNCFRADQMGFGQVFDKLTFKRMTVFGYMQFYANFDYDRKD